MRYQLQDGNIILADQAFIDANHPGAILLPDVPVPAPVITTLSKLDYMNRFTDAELADIYTAAKTVVQVEVWLEKFKQSEFIDLADPRTISGVQALEAARLLAVGRASEILALG